MSREDRYRLCAFVGSNGEADEKHDIGFSTFTDIYVRRADKQRYAVAENEKEQFLAWDLYDASKSADGTKFFPPQPIRICETCDQAIMATVLTAEEPD